MAGQGGSPVARAVGFAVRSRRRVATVFALLLALFCGWHAFFGQNGITAYAAKRTEDRALQSQISKLAEENRGLKDHVDHLQSDPETIELEARQRLHYTRHGEVIYTLDGTPGPPTPSPAR